MEGVMAIKELGNRSRSRVLNLESASLIHKAVLRLKENNLYVSVLNAVTHYTNARY